MAEFTYRRDLSEPLSNEQMDGNLDAIEEAYDVSVSAAAAASASANFKGAWSTLTGALAIPASVSHSGAVWVLTESVADITANEPGVAAVWIRDTYEVGTTAGTVAAGDHLHSSVYEPAFTKNTAFNKNLGTTAGTVAAGDDARFLTTPQKTTLTKITEAAGLPLWDGGAWPGGGGESWELFHIQDQKANNTYGGGLTTGTRNIRTLNTVVTNEITGASLATNQVTLPAGYYIVVASCPAVGVTAHKATLYSVTGTANVLVGTTERSAASTENQTRSFVIGAMAPAGTTVYELSHYVGATVNTLGAGWRGGFGIGEVYSDIRIYRKVTA